MLYLNKLNNKRSSIKFSSGRQLPQDVKAENLHILTRLSAKQNFIEFRRHESFWLEGNVKYFVRALSDVSNYICAFIHV